MSLSEIRQRLDAAKKDIAAQITHKGVTVPQGTRIHQMAPLIKEIKTGGLFLDIVTSTYVPPDVVNGRLLIITHTPSDKTILSYTVPSDPAAGDIWIHLVDNGGYSLSADGAIGMNITPGIVTQFNGTLWDYCNAYIGHENEWKMLSTSTPFAKLRWEHIVAIANSGEDCSLFFAVGDEHDLILSTGDHITAVIGDFAINTLYVPPIEDIRPYDSSLHPIYPDPAETKYAAIALTFKNCLTTLYSMNAEDSTVGTWVGSDMCMINMPAILSTFPSALRAENAIKEITTYTAMNVTSSAQVQASADRLRLHSITELGLSSSYAAKEEGVAYEYYSTAANRAKKLFTSNHVYWTRSPRLSSATSFCCISATGSATTAVSSKEYGVACAFDL